MLLPRHLLRGRRRSPLIPLFHDLPLQDVNKFCFSLVFMCFLGGGFEMLLPGCKSLVTVTCEDILGRFSKFLRHWLYPCSNITCGGLGWNFIVPFRC